MRVPPTRRAHSASRRREQCGEHCVPKGVNIAVEADMRTRVAIIAFACLLCPMVALAAGPEGSLALGASSYQGQPAGYFYARTGMSYGMVTPGVRALGLASPGTLAYAVAPELRWRFGGMLKVNLAFGAGVGQVFQPDPVLAQHTPLGLYTYGSAGISYSPDSHLSWGLEATLNHWAGMGSLATGGSNYRMPLDQPLWLASITYSP